jgi:hypothetical protein
LGNAVEPAEREAWLGTMAERGCAPCNLGLHNIRWPRLCQGWSFNPTSIIARQRAAGPTDSARRPRITQTTNLRAVPAGALAIGVAALRRWGLAHPEVEVWGEMATHSLAVFRDIYLPDGSYDEGVHYANYTSESIFIAAVALHRQGLDDLRGLIDWSAHVRYMLHLAMPTRDNLHEVVNISDNGRLRGAGMFKHPAGKPESRSALPFWVARENRDGLAQWFGENLAAEPSVWSLIFFDETVPPEPPEPGPRTWFPDVDWVVARTGWRAEDLVVSLRSGPGANHEHADRNSLIVKYAGEVLVADPLRPPYPYADPAWLLRTTAGHSAVLVNGEGHFYHNGVEGTPATIAMARIAARAAGPDWSWWTSDATQAYRLVNRDIRAVLRLVWVDFALATVVVVDRVTQYGEPAMVEARFFADNWDGEARLEARAGGFLSRRREARLVAHLASSSPFTVGRAELPIPAERAAEHPFIGVVIEPAGATTLVSVLTLASGDEAAASATVQPAAGGWRVRLTRGVAARVIGIEETDTTLRATYAG